jgi:hypothetical protein
MEEQMVRRMVIPLLVLLLAFQGCAVQRSKAPQIDAKAAFALNLESQVTQANKDYTTFFTDVGNSQRAGLLTSDNVATLNIIGHKLKSTIEEADRLTKAYAASYDSGVAATIGSLLSQIAADLVVLATTQAQMKAGIRK